MVDKDQKGLGKQTTEDRDITHRSVTVTHFFSFISVKETKK